MSASEIYGTVRSNWRAVLLVLLLTLSALALFGPIGTDSAGPTNLQYGLQLGGGTRIRAPVVGMTAEFGATDAAAVDGNRTAIQQSVTDIEGVESEDVLVRVDRGNQNRIASASVELFTDNVSEEEFAAALQEAGLDASTGNIRDGVTSQTRSEIVDTIRSKINEAGFSGSEVSQTSTVTGQNFVVIEAPNRDPAEIRRLVNDRGVVRVVARYPAVENGSVVRENGSIQFVNRTALSPDELVNARVGVAQEDQRTGQTYVPITLQNRAVAENFSQVLVQGGFTSNQGISNCPRQWRAANNSPTYCLLTVSDGQVVYAAGVDGGLAQQISSGSFANEPSFRMLTNNISEAQELQIDLRGGRLRSRLNFSAGQTFTLEPGLASRFKLNSLVTGIVAVLAVSVVVFFRYGDSRVAVPMIVTALSEVAILLGFAAAIRLQLNLSHIAGFIAVIGTGVDDLIIIADEVMSEGDVSSGRVFQSRFRKAFWVIGAAAATTIIAMSPLAVLSLGDLRGFALITILGVLVGVLVTRPAYGDILRGLLTDR